MPNAGAADAASADPLPRAPRGGRGEDAAAPRRARRPREVEAAEAPGRGGTNLLFALLAVVGVLYFARDLLIPLVLAALLAFVLAGPATLLRRLRVPRVPAVLLTVLLAFALLLGGGVLLGGQVARLAADLPRYQATVASKLGGLTGEDSLVARAADLLRDLGQSLAPGGGERPAPTAPTATVPSAVPPPAQPAELPPVPVVVREPDATPLQLIERIVAPLLGPVATTGIVLVFVVFLLLYREDLRDRAIRLMGTRDLGRTTAALDDAGSRLSRFFLTQTATNIAYGTVMGLILWAMGVPGAALWGVLAGLMRYVPYVGTLVAVAFPALLALAADPGWSLFAYVIALYAVAEGLMGNAVEPMLFGQSTGISPLAVLVATAFWTFLWGPIGLLIATPLTVGLVVLGRHVEALEFLDVMLGDRPPLEPAEAFYQRALADDAHGLADLADAHLKREPLAAFYDEVAVPALALAQTDAARGALRREQVDCVRGRVEGLLDDLDGHEDADPPVAGAADGDAKADAEAAAERDAAADRDAPVPPAWAEDGAVLVVAGRGRFDEDAAAMLAGVLRQRGVGARVMANEALRGRGALSDGGGGGAAVRAVVLSALDGGSGAASARYALRRLARRFPGVPLFLGAWGAGRGGGLAEALKEDRAGAAPHAAVATLREAADAILTAARAEEGEAAAASPGTMPSGPRPAPAAPPRAAPGASVAPPVPA